jgi:hypothetical protein
MRRAAGSRSGEAASGTGRVMAFARPRRRDPEAARVVDLVAAARQASALLLLHPSRCDAPVAEARQLAMYLMHVILARSYPEIGSYFRRDRTTVAHACALIEDRRDDPGFDAEVCGLEAALAGGRPEANRARA